MFKFKKKPTGRIIKGEWYKKKPCFTCGKKTRYYNIDWHIYCCCEKCQEEYKDDMIKRYKK